MSPESRQPAGSSRLRDSLLKPGRGQVVVAVLLGVLAFAAVTQVRENGQDQSYSGLRQPELIQALNGLSAASRRAETDITELEQTRDKLRDSTQRRSTALKQARQELAALGILAGTTPAEGEGLRIKVTESVGHPLSINLLLDGIQELRDAGAEAIVINDSVRVVAQTSFEDADTGIRVDGRQLSAPYVIQAIGDPDTMATALEITGGFVENIELAEGKAKVTKEKNLKLTVTRKPSAPKYAQPVD